MDALSPPHSLSATAAKGIRRRAAWPALLAAAAGLWLSAATPASAINYFYSSLGSLPPEGRLYGDAQVGGGALKLTTAAGGTGSFVLDDLDCGRPVTYFYASFDMYIGGGSGADGMSFNFAPDLPNGGFSEGGGGSGITVSFDTFYNGPGDCAPRIGLRYQGQLLACFNQNPRTSDFVPIQIELRSNGLLLVFFNSSLTTYYVNTSYTPTAGRFGFGARTGGLTDNHWIRNLLIYTEVQGQQQPTLSCPSVLEAASTNGSNSVVTFQVASSDDCPAQPGVSCSPASGSSFPLGLTQVNCDATDADHVTVRCSFPVWVVNTTPVFTNCSRHVLLCGTNMDPSIQSNLTAMGHSSELVAPANLSTASFSGFHAIWLGGGTAFPGLAARRSDLLNFVNAGGVLLAEFTADSNDLPDYPLTEGVACSPVAGDTVRILDHCHPLNARLVNTGLGGWGFSYHRAFTNLGGFIGVTDTGEPGKWVTLHARVGNGDIIYTAQDISEHIRTGAGVTGAASPKGVLLNNALTMECPLAVQSFVGPDAFGYLGQRAAFAFEDISATGSRVLDNHDDEMISAPLGFDFVHYDRPCDRVWITPNGNVSFWTGELPSLAVLWDDWVSNVMGSDAVYYATLGVAPRRRFVVQWNQVFGYLSRGPVTFQVTLSEGSNDILFQYLDAQTEDYRTCGGHATVGIRDYQGQFTGRNLAWSYARPIIHDGEAILFRYPPGPVIAEQPRSQTVVVGEPVALRVIAAGGPPLTFQWRFNGTAITGATNSTLDFSSIQTTNSGSYDVTVANASGNSLTSAVAVVIVTTCAPLQNGLVGWWRAESNALNRSTAWHGTLGDDASYAPGKVGTAFRFDGTNDYVQIPSAAVGSSYSMLFWFNPAAVPGATGAGLIANDPASANFGAIYFTPMGELQYKQAGTVRATTPPGLAQVNQWTHAALTHDGAITRLYLNGTTRAVSSAYAAQFFNGLTFGTEGSRSFAGGLDEVMLFNRALSSNEVRAMFEATAAGICIPPAFSVLPSSTTACLGSNAVLAGFADGSEPLTYEWRRDGVPIPGATNNILSFSAVTTNDAGNYALFARNAYGSFVSTAVLTVIRCTVALPDTLAATQNNTATFDFDALTTNDVNGSLNPTNSRLMVASVSSNSAAGGKVSIVATQRWVRTHDTPGTGVDSAEYIALDSQGDIFVAGQSASSGEYDILVLKYSPEGLPLRTNRFNGAANLSDVVYAIAVDPQDNLIVAGYGVRAAGPDVQNRDAVVLKYSNDLTVVWTNWSDGIDSLGLQDEGRAVAVDAAGNIYVAGVTALSGSGLNFHTRKLSPTNTELWRVIYSGPGNGNDIPTAIGLDTNGNVYVSGYADFGSGGGRNDFVTIKYSNDGTPQWNNQWNVYNSDDYGYAAVVDATGNVHVTGEAFNPGGGGNNLATRKYNSAGSLQWQDTYPGPGNGTDRGKQIALDPAGNVFVTGFSVGSGTFEDFVTASYTPGGTLRWLRRFDVVGKSDLGAALAVDRAGNAYVTGYADTSGTGLGYDFATIKYASDGAPQWTNYWSGTPGFDDYPYANVVDGEGRLFVTGRAYTAAGNSAFVTLRLDQQVRYVPPPGFYGTDTFTYVIADSVGGMSTGTVTVTVAPIPAITSLGATNSSIGSTLAINGTGFNLTASNNIVWFGAVRAQVVSATSTQLVVTVPAGATYAPVTVTVGGFTASSRVPFNLTFPSNLAIDASTFAPRVDVNTGARPYGVAVGDLDGDGKPDVVVCNFDGDSVSIFRNTNSPGSIVMSALVSAGDLNCGDGPQFVTLADLDGDGKLDLITSDYAGSTISVFRNLSIPGSVSFSPRVPIPAGANVLGIQVADFDGDGKADIAVAGHNAARLKVFRFIGGPDNITPTSFAAPLEFLTGAGPFGVAVLDADRDGLLDLAVANFDGGTVRVRRNLSQPGVLAFPSEVNSTVGLYPKEITAVDIDGDGRLDLVCGNEQSASISMVRNESSPGVMAFATSVPFAIGPGPFGVAAGDLNGDGKPDLAVATVGNSTVSIFRNTGTPGVINAGSFAPRIDIAGGGGAHRVAIADMDGDGRPDLIIANLTANTVSIFRNQISPPPPAISSLSATNGPIGSTLVINGANFSTNATNNVVWFGAVRAQVVSATSTQLVVTVPAGASYAPVTVTVGGFTAYSSTPFTPIFPSNLTLETNTFANRFVLSLPGLPGPDKVSVGDVDGDGKPDICVSLSLSNAVAIFRNIGTGALSAASFAVPTNFPAGAGPVGNALADVDGDGKPDLIVANQSNGKVAVLRNVSVPGGINFTSAAVLSVGATPDRVVVADFDGDGRTEIVVSDSTVGNTLIYVYRFTGAAGSITPASFAGPYTFATGARPLGPAVADFDRDGKLDLAVSDRGDSTVSVLRNASVPGSLAFTRAFFASGSGLQPLVAGDLDGDGVADLAVASQDNNVVSVHRNTSSTNAISFAGRVDFAAGSGTYEVALGDLNGDGNPDFTAVSYVSETVSVRQNKSTPGAISSGSFGPEIRLSSPGDPHKLAIADLDGDARPDIIAVNYANNSLSVWRNVIPPPPPTITAQPLSRAAAPGNTVTFTVSAITYGPTNYQWRFNGLDFLGATNRTLTLTNVQAANFGTYAVLVSDGTRFVTSSNAVLSLALPPLIQPPTRNGTTLTMVFPTELGPTYRVEYKVRLDAPAWSLLTSLNGTGESVTVTDATSGASQRFYRIRVE